MSFRRRQAAQAVTRGAATAALLVCLAWTRRFRAVSTRPAQCPLYVQLEHCSLTGSVRMSFPVSAPDCVVPSCIRRFDCSPPAMAASVHVYPDGSVLVASGGLEMGQGLFTKVKQVKFVRL